MSHNDDGENDRTLEEMREYLKRTVERGKESRELSLKLLQLIKESSGEKKEILQQLMQAMDDIHYFYSASSNSGEIFSHLGTVAERRSDLLGIGATGCVAALDKLLPLYRKWMELHEVEEKVNLAGEVVKWMEDSKESDEFLEKHAKEIREAELLAEDDEELQMLLIKAEREIVRKYSKE